MFSNSFFVKKKPNRRSDGKILGPGILKTDPEVRKYGKIWALRTKYLGLVHHTCTRHRTSPSCWCSNRIFVALEALKTSTTTRTLMVPSLSALVVFATPSEEPLRRSALMYFIRSAAINPATSASIVMVAAAVAAAAIDGDACCDGSLLVAPPSSPVKIIHGQKGERKRSERLSHRTIGADHGS